MTIQDSLIRVKKAISDCLVWLNFLRPRQQFFSHCGTLYFELSEKLYHLKNSQSSSIFMEYCKLLHQNRLSLLENNWCESSHYIFAD